VCKGGQHQVAGFGSVQADFHRFPVTHLAHQNHLRGLAQGGPEAVGETVEIGTQFPLVEGGLLMGMLVFNGIFQGNHMNGAGLVDLFQNGRQTRSTYPNRWRR
jgi:hypothetical protein